MERKQSTTITISLAIGPAPEPPISDEQYFNSYLQYGVWMRVLPALKMLEVTANENVSDLERLSAAAAFHQFAALQVEDSLSNLVAWQARHYLKDQRIADILHRVFMKRGDSTDPNILDRANRDLAKPGGKKVAVDPGSLTTQLLAMSPDRFLRRFGLTWAPALPSALESSPRQLLEWANLRETSHNIAYQLSGPGGQLLSAYYNKIKHGPQIVVSNIREAALRRGHPAIQAEGLPDDARIRALMHGASVQETADQQSRGERVAPFLTHEPYLLSGVLCDSMYFVAEGMRRLGFFYAKCVLGLNVRTGYDPAVSRFVDSVRTRWVAERPTSEVWRKVDHE